MDITPSVSHTSYQLSSLLPTREETSDAQGAWHLNDRGPVLQLQKNPLWHLLNTEEKLCAANSDYRRILKSTDIVLTSPEVGDPYEVKVTAGPLCLDSYRMEGSKEIPQYGSHELTMTFKLSLNELRQESDPSEIEVNIGKVTIETRTTSYPGEVHRRHALSATHIDNFDPDDSAESYRRTFHEVNTPVTVKSHNFRSALGSVKGQPSLYLKSKLICTVQPVPSQMNVDDKVTTWLSRLQ